LTPELVTGSWKGNVDGVPTNDVTDGRLPQAYVPDMLEEVELLRAGQREDPQSAPGQRPSIAAAGVRCGSLELSGDEGNATFPVMTLDRPRATGDDRATSAPPRGFARAEYEGRTVRAQRGMAAAGLDGLLLTTEAEVRYFSGFHTQFWESPTRPWFLVVPRDAAPIAVIPEIGAAGMAQTWIEDIRTWAAPNPADDGVSLLAAALQEVAGATGRIGVPMGHETHLRMPIADFGRLRDRLPGVELGDAAPLVRDLRAVKSEAEIAKIRHVCRLTSDAFEGLPRAVAAGQSEREICRTLRLGLLARGADHSPYLIGAAGPGGYDNIVMGPTDRIVDVGDVLIIDTGTTFDGYFCDFDRNFAFGAPDDAVRRAYAAAYAATDAGFAAARPGNTAADLFAAMWPVLEAAGALGNDVGRLGHGLGMQLTEGHSNMPGDHTVLRPGMVLTLEPGMMFAPGKLMVHEENIVIREDGAEWLTRRAAPEMPVIG
jgi:Xaa-Pro dipeptidase